MGEKNRQFLKRKEKHTTNKAKSLHKAGIVYKTAFEWIWAELIEQVNTSGLVFKTEH